MRIHAHSQQERRDEEGGLEFDADLCPASEHNKQVAERRKLTYDPHERVYKDSDGCPLYDQFGQPL